MQVPKGLYSGHLASTRCLRPVHSGTPVATRPGMGHPVLAPGSPVQAPRAVDSGTPGTELGHLDHLQAGPHP